MIARLLSLLTVVSLLAPTAHAHQGNHNILDPCEDARIGLEWFRFDGDGVVGSRNQDHFEPQFYTLKNLAAPNALPQSLVQVGFALGQFHQTSSSDYHVKIILPSGTREFNGSNFPGHWQINPLLEGWSGTFSVIMTNTVCNFTLQATATWNFPKPEWLRNPCGPCYNLTCDSTTGIESVHLSIPAGVMHYGLQPVALMYDSEQILNEGAAALVLDAPSGNQGPVVQKSDEVINSVECHQHLTRIIPEPSPEDPNRFVIKVSSDKNDPDNTVYRESIVENLTLTGGTTALCLTETVAGKTSVHQYTQPAANQWILEEDSLRRTTKTTLSETATTRIIRRLVEEKDASGTWVAVDHLEEHETKYEWGWQLTRRILDPDNEALTFEWDYYSMTEFSGPNSDTVGRGRLQSETLPTGLLRTYEYHDSDPYNSGYSYLEVVREAFAGSPNSSETRRHVSSDGIELDELQETFVGGALVRKVEITARSAGGINWREERHHPSAAGPPLLTRFELDSNPNTPLLQKTLFPDGTLEQIEFTESGGMKTHTVYRGVRNPGPGFPILTGQETRTVINEVGQVMHRETCEIRNGVVFPIEMQLATEFDALDRPTSTEVFHSGSTTPTFRSTQQFGCCGLETQTGQDLIPTTFFYDELNRLTKAHRNGLSTETVYDGLTVRSHLYPEASPTPLSFAAPENEAAFVTRNLAGDTVAEGTRAPHDGSLVTTTTATTYNPGSGVGQRVVRTLPATPDDQGVTPNVTEDYFLDGQLKQRTGPLVADRVLTYGADPGGLTATVALLDGTATARQAVTTHLDWMGRALKTTYSGDADGNGSPDEEHFEYNSGGRLSKRTDPDGVITLYEYDLLNEITRSALDLNRNGLLEPDLDEVRLTRNGVAVNGSGEVISWSENVVRDVDGTGAGLDRLLARHETSADLLKSWTSVYSGGATNTTAVTTAFLPAQPGAWDVTTLQPDGTSLHQEFREGLLDTDTLRAADASVLLTRHYTYDDHLRLLRLDDTSAPALQRTYLAPLIDSPSTITIGTRTTLYEYDQRGRPTLVDEPDSLDHNGLPVDNRQLTSYWPHGGVREVTGTPGYRRSFTYDFAQRPSTLTTYGATQTTTRWEYESDRGWLRAKRYNSPAPGAGSGETYTFSAAGRLTQRLTARGITTSYTHSTDGRLAAITYSDGTPGVTIAERDRRGRIARLTDAAGERHLSYTDQGRLAATVYQPGSLLAGWTVSAPVDPQERLSSLTLEHDALPHHQLDYAYDSAGRLASVEGGGLKAHYRYDPARQLVSQLSIVNHLRPLHFATRQYDELNRLARITYHNGQLQGAFASRSDFHYQRDPYGRITHATLRDGTQWRYAYNPAGEIASAKRHLTTTSPALLAGHNFAWSYDGIGNRLSATRGGDGTGSGTRTTSSSANPLNQLTSISTPGIADLTGAAPTAPEVLVNGSPATRQGSFFRFELAADNSAGPVLQPVTVSQGPESKSGALLIPPATATPLHDPDGNLRDDGVHQFTWDAENRLAGIETLPSSVAAGLPYRRVAFTYDSDSRRVQRLEFDQPAPAPPLETTRYLYAGWRCLGELDATDTLQRTYAWGLDNHDRLHLGDSNAALLWLHDHASSETHLTSYDGNGNITALQSAQTDKLTATYTYSPFGQLLTSTGPYADQNPYRFSTKPLEPVGGLYNYGFRHYSPGNGRWLSRDPIQEDGGLNLYGFVGNEPVGNWDLLGLDSFTDREERYGFLQFGADFLEGIGGIAHTPGELAGAVHRQMISEGYNPLTALYGSGLAFTSDLTGTLNIVELGLGVEFSVGPDGGVATRKFGSVGEQAKHAAWGELKVALTMMSASGFKPRSCKCPSSGKPPPLPPGRFPKGVSPKGDVRVLGKLPDTDVARGWPGHEVLAREGWTPEQNIAWIKQAVEEARTFYLASPVKGNLYNAQGGLSVFAKELQLLMKSGYKRVGDYLVPPC